MKMNQLAQVITDQDLHTYEEGIDFSLVGEPIKDQRTLPSPISYDEYPVDVLQCSFLPGEHLPIEIELL